MPAVGSATAPRLRSSPLALLRGCTMRAIFPVPDQPGRSFASLFNEAATCDGEKARTILIQPNTRILIDDDTMLILKKNNVLVKIAMIGGDIEGRPVISSNAHSVFKVTGRKSFLNLENIIINHTCYNISQTLIGSCIFAMHHADIMLHSCDLSSSHGFGLWAVQSSRMTIRKSNVTSLRRSGIVVFGSAVLDMEESMISKCKQHGVCMRGSSSAVLTHCELLDNGARAIYAYLTVSLNLQSCRIAGTTSAAHAAVDIWSTMNHNATVSREEKRQRGQSFKAHEEEEKKENHCTFVHKGRFNCLRLTVSGCTIQDNRGIGLRLRYGGIAIQKDISDCIIDNNDQGDIIIIESPDENDYAVDPMEDQHKERFDAIWQFECDDNEWKNYSNTDSNCIEIAMKAEKKL